MFLLLTASTLWNFSKSSPQMADHDTPDVLVIAGLGSFQAQRDGGILGLYCFSKAHPFLGQTVELVVYPNEDGTWPSDTQRRELASKFRRFQASAESALHELPSWLVPLCKQYSIYIDHLAPSQLTSGFTWQNVKLLPEGEIECYTMNKSVTKTFNLVIRFSSAVIISDVYFDG